MSGLTLHSARMRPYASPMPRKRLKAQETRPAPAPVRAFRPDPLLWKTALRLAKGDPQRVEVISETEALVHNS